ncbi:MULTISPECIES: hypothetical protein [Clavibacter]|uniref:Uncharacterized protein n=1 Tax=Clavibacter tessellarius TaxID=31965 RepID=A0A154UYB5_9MICO|nr:hypothetical protein [Clavibacter michiganensis]KZC94122.1 hypothetical protein AWH51_14610 [Clavibacter michiganensis subsp. tessellarius]
MTRAITTAATAALALALGLAATSAAHADTRYAPTITGDPAQSQSIAWGSGDTPPPLPGHHHRPAATHTTPGQAHRHG